MTKFELLQMANRYYPDGGLDLYFDEEGNFLPDVDGGDGLARFIVCELVEAVDVEDDEDAMLGRAERLMYRAIEDIKCVLQGLSFDQDGG